MTIEQTDAQQENARKNRLLDIANGLYDPYKVGNIVEVTENPLRSKGRHQIYEWAVGAQGEIIHITSDNKAVVQMGNFTQCISLNHLKRTSKGDRQDCRLKWGDIVKTKISYLGLNKGITGVVKFVYPSPDYGPPTVIVEFEGYVADYGSSLQYKPAHTNEAKVQVPYLCPNLRLKSSVNQMREEGGEEELGDNNNNDKKIKLTDIQKASLDEDMQTLVEERVFRTDLTLGDTEKFMSWLIMQNKKEFAASLRSTKQKQNNS